MSDNIHLERFLNQGQSQNDISPTDEAASLLSITPTSDFVDASQNSPRKASTLRRFFQRRKRLYSSDASLNRKSPQQLRRCEQDSEIGERRPSIDWSLLSKKKTKFVLIYRRKSTELVLYSTDLLKYPMNQLTIPQF